MKILPIIASVAVLAVAPIASAQKGGVAVLDIDRVAKELKVDQSVLVELKNIEGDLNAQLNQIRGNLQTRMNQLETRAGQQRTQQIQAELANANRQLNQQFNQVKAQAQSKMAAERIKRINDFREKVKPIAQEAAKSRGLDVVLTKAPEVFAFVEAVDITDDVIDGARAAGLEAELPPADATTTTTEETPAATNGEAPASGPAAPASGPVSPTPEQPAGQGKGKGENN